MTECDTDNPIEHVLSSEDAVCIFFSFVPSHFTTPCTTFVFLKKRLKSKFALYFIVKIELILLFR